MPQKLPISVVIPTHQERDNLAVLLPMLDFAQEVFVVDSFSTDGTQTLARELGARVEERPYISPADQKNWAMQAAKFDWILLLDADERPKPGLAEELAALLAEPNPTCFLYWLRRENYLLGRRVRYSGWQGDKVLRFLHRAHGAYDPKQQVHEEIEGQGPKRYLQHALEHYTYRDLSHFLAKQERYALWSAQDKAAKTGRITWFHWLIKPSFRFFKHFVLQLGFLDGYRGFLISVLGAWTVFLRYAHLWAQRQKT